MNKNIRIINLLVDIADRYRTDETVIGYQISDKKDEGIYANFNLNLYSQIHIQVDTALSNSEKICLSAELRDRHVEKYTPCKSKFIGEFTIPYDISEVQKVLGKKVPLLKKQSNNYI